MDVSSEIFQFSEQKVLESPNFTIALIQTPLFDQLELVGKENRKHSD